MILTLDTTGWDEEKQRHIALMVEGLLHANGIETAGTWPDHAVKVTGEDVKTVFIPSEDESVKDLVTPDAIARAYDEFTLRYVESAKQSRDAKQTIVLDVSDWDPEKRAAVHAAVELLLFQHGIAYHGDIPGAGLEVTGDTMKKIVVPRPSADPTEALSVENISAVCDRLLEERRAVNSAVAKHVAAAEAELRDGDEFNEKGLDEVEALVAGAKELDEVKALLVRIARRQRANEIVRHGHL